MASNTFGPLSVARWRAAGYYVDNVEQFIRLPGGAGYRKDLFGFVDLVAVHKTDRAQPLTFIQSTGWANMSARVKKIRDESTGRGDFTYPIRFLAADLLNLGVRIVIEGWRKGANGRWEFKERILTLEDIVP